MPRAAHSTRGLTPCAHCGSLLGSKRQRMAHTSTSKQVKYVTNAHFLKQKSDEETHDWSSDGSASAASAGEEEAAPATTTA